MKVVLDANVIVAAFAARGLCEALFQYCIGSCELACSEHLLREVERALTSKIKMTTQAAGEIVAFLRQNAEIAAPSPVPHGACRDKSDAHVLGLAMTVRADYLVTGDKDLLEVVLDGTGAIVTPRSFWEGIQSRESKRTP
ncbi:putative toxin-antitoxin system toxin component, PIN family [bacterium]|nr:putative toxin-antitoxin system toxin component, PIN family [bacterium]